MDEPTLRKVLREELPGIVAGIVDSRVRLLLGADPTHPDNLRTIHADTAAIRAAVAPAKS